MERWQGLPLEDANALIRFLLTTGHQASPWPPGKAVISHSGSGGRKEEKTGMLWGLPQGWSCQELGGAPLGRSDSPSGSCRTRWRRGWAAGGHKAGFSWCGSRKQGSKMLKHKGGWAAIRTAILRWASHGVGGDAPEGTAPELRIPLPGGNGSSRVQEACSSQPGPPLGQGLVSGLLGEPPSWPQTA